MCQKSHKLVFAFSSPKKKDFLHFLITFSFLLTVKQFFPFAEKHKKGASEHFLPLILITKRKNHKSVVQIKKRLLFVYGLVCNFSEIRLKTKASSSFLLRCYQRRWIVKAKMLVNIFLEKKLFSIFNKKIPHALFLSRLTTTTRETGKVFIAAQWIQ